MSVTAAQGFTASGVAARISKLGPDLALVVGERRVRRRRRCSREPRAGGAGRRQQGASRARRAAGRRDQLRERERRDRRAGRRRCARDGGGDGAPARPRARAGARPLDRRDRRAAADRPRAAPASRRRGRALGRRRRRRRAGDPHDRHAHEGEPSRTATASRVGGMAKGSGMIHPEPRDDARGRHDRLSARARRADRRSSGPRSRRASTRSRSTASARRTTPSSCSRAARGDAEATTRLSREALHAVCADLAGQIVADGEGATVVAEINVTGAATQAEAKAVARRIATSPLVKTALFGKDANWGRVLAAAGSAPFNGGYAQLDPEPRDAVATTARRCSTHGAPQGIEPDVERRDVHDRPRPRARRRRSAAT